MKFTVKIVATIFASIGGLLSFSTEATAQGPRKIAAASVTFWVGEDGNVYSSGAAEPHRGDKPEGTRAHFEKIEGVSDIVSVDVGAETDIAAALDSDGNVWSLGEKPTMFPGLSDIKSIALGDNHLVALNSAGRVFTVGLSFNANQSGALGTGDFETPKSTDLNFGVVSIKGIDDAVAVETTSEATYIVRSDGSVWGMGSRFLLGNRYTVLDLDKQDAANFSQARPAPIKGLSKIVTVSAGKGFAIALDQNGDVWAWGAIGEDILGVESLMVASYAPMKIAGLKNITSISAGYGVILAINRSGEVLGIGSNVHNTVAGDGESVTGKARRVPGFKEHGKAKQVFAGDYNAFALMESGKYVAWGTNASAVGGFHPKADRTVTTPVEIDPGLRPDPPSDTILDGGVEMITTLSLDSYCFVEEEVTLAIDGEVVGTLKVSQANDEAEFIIEVAKGLHSYQVSGEAVTEEGVRYKIDFSSVLMVSPQPVSEQFESLCKEHGMIEAVKRIQTKIEAFDDTMKSPALKLESSGPLTAAQVSQLETDFGIALPDSYKKTLEQIGPFQIGTAGCPMPYVGLFLPKLDRNVAEFAKQAEALSGKNEGIPDPQWAETVQAFEWMRPYLPSAAKRKDWHRNLILGVSYESLYMLVRQKHKDDSQPAPVLWSDFFVEMQNEHEEPLGYFLWSEMASSDDDSLEILQAGCRNAICEGYKNLGFSPHVSNSTRERVYSSLKSNIEDLPKAGDVLQYRLHSDGW